MGNKEFRRLLSNQVAWVHHSSEVIGRRVMVTNFKILGCRISLEVIMPHNQLNMLKGNTGRIKYVEPRHKIRVDRLTFIQ